MLEEARHVFKKVCPGTEGTCNLKKSLTVSTLRLGLKIDDRGVTQSLCGAEHPA